jgi:hypothetical protein
VNAAILTSDDSYTYNELMIAEKLLDRLRNLEAAENMKGEIRWITRSGQPGD